MQLDQQAFHNKKQNNEINQNLVSRSYERTQIISVFVLSFFFVMELLYFSLVF